MKRRQFLAVIGGGVVLAAGAATMRVTRSAAEAAAPWQAAGSEYDEVRRKALSYAILAPNPHNMQPWKVDLSVPDTLTLYPDTTRLLPHTDPNNRQITVGLGCFLELMVMAAAEDGVRVDLNVFPQGSDSDALDERPVAVARFVKDATVSPDPLFAYVLQRRSNKEAYDTSREVASDTLTRIAESARVNRIGWTNTMDEVEDIRTLTQQASTIEMETPRTHKESVDVFRIGAKEVISNPDGIDLSGPLMEALSAVGMLNREDMMRPGQTGFEQGREAVLGPLRSSMAYMWMVSPTNDRASQIAAGRDWLRVNLACTREGVDMQPNSQALQEYPEMAALYAKVHEMWAADGGTVQMLLRLGYGETVPASPRWPLEAKLIDDRTAHLAAPY
ncbi:MAG: twin-arginine translocation pathway signal protein [Pseudomonadota bacterium]